MTLSRSDFPLLEHVEAMRPLDLDIEETRRREGREWGGQFYSYETYNPTSYKISLERVFASHLNREISAVNFEDLKPVPALDTLFFEKTTSPQTAFRVPLTAGQYELLASGELSESVLPERAISSLVDSLRARVRDIDCVRLSTSSEVSFTDRVFERLDREVKRQRLQVRTSGVHPEVLRLMAQYLQYAIDWVVILDPAYKDRELEPLIKAAEEAPKKAAASAEAENPDL